MKTITSSTGIPLPMHGTIDECATAEVVFFASGIGTRKLIRDPEYLQRLRSKLDPGKQLIGSMCSGSLILAALGLLGKEAREEVLAAVMPVGKALQYA